MTEQKMTNETGVVGTTIVDRRAYIATLVRQAMRKETQAYAGATVRERNKLLAEAVRMKAAAQAQCATYGLDYATILD